MTVGSTAERIRAIRTERGLSQEALAYRAEVSVATVGRIERGVGDASVAVLSRLARVLGVSPGSLLEEPEREPAA